MYFILVHPSVTAPQYASLMDKRVVIHGTSRADVNGKCGVATDFHPMDPEDRTTWRYTVRLDSGNEVKLRRERLRAEGEGAPAGAGGGGRTKKEKKGGKGGKRS